MEDRPAQGKRLESATRNTAEVMELREQMERANNAIETLVNRTNTLVHLLDILNKRVDRLESQQGS